MRRTPEVTRQGHWHIDHIRPLARARGVRAWEIATDQKRPAVQGHAWHSEDDGLWLRIDIESRHGSLGFRDGEDGTVATEVRLPIPRPSAAQRWWREHIEHLPGGQHWTVAVDHDKWAVYVVVVAIV